MVLGGVVGDGGLSLVLFLEVFDVLFPLFSNLLDRITLPHLARCLI